MWLSEADQCEFESDRMCLSLGVFPITAVPQMEAYSVKYLLS